MRLGGRGGRSLVTHGGRIVDEDFSGRHLEQFSPDGTAFVRCRFDGVVIDSASFGAGMRDSRYVDCSFNGARLRMFSVGFARLERCSFEDVRIRDFFATGLELVECVFSGRMERGWLDAGVLEEDAVELGRERNEIRGNDFSRLKFVDFGFAGGVDLTAQKLPAGPEYVYIGDFPAAVRRAREAMLAESDLDLRREAFSFIQLWEMEVRGGQRQQLLREADYSRNARPVFRRLVETMTTPSS